MTPYYKPHRPHGLSRLNVDVDALRQRLTPTLPPTLPFLQEASPSRLQRRLQHSLKRDRTFFELVRRKRAHLLNPPSWLSQQLIARQPSQPLQSARLWRPGLLLLLVGLGVGGAIWTSLFVNERVTLAGVPYEVVNKFWQDEPARAAYFGGDRLALHDRLQTLGVEEDIKAFYRDRFDNEYELDRHIHQLMFNQTGYVGEAYDVNDSGQLSSRSY
jgi:hypothetical protein